MCVRNEQTYLRGAPCVPKHRDFVDFVTPLLRHRMATKLTKNHKEHKGDSQ